MDLTIWLLAAGATVRLTLLLTRDAITSGLREQAQDWSAIYVGGARGRVAWWWAGVTGCPWCASPYIAALILAARPLPGWWAVCTVAVWSLAAGLVGEALAGDR